MHQRNADSQALGEQRGEPMDAPAITQPFNPMWWRRTLRYCKRAPARRAVLEVLFGGDAGVWW